MAILAPEFHRSRRPATTLAQWLASYLLHIGDGIVSAVMGYFLDVPSSFVVRRRLGRRMQADLRQSSAMVVNVHTADDVDLKKPSKMRVH
jgi:hypothetical protein